MLLICKTNYVRIRHKYVRLHINALLYYVVNFESWQPILGLNIYNWIYFKVSEKVIICKGVFEVSPSNQDIFDRKELGDVAIATKVGKTNKTNIKTTITSIVGRYQQSVWFWDRIFAISKLN